MKSDSRKRLFISYSRVDAQFADDLIAKIQRALPNLMIWQDTGANGLVGGDDWWVEILKAIAEADVFIYILSNESVNSPYCKSEFAEAERLQKQKVLIQARDRTILPDYLKSIQLIDMKSGVNDVSAFADVIRALSKQLGLARKRRPLWQPPTSKPDPQQPLSQNLNQFPSNVTNVSVSISRQVRREKFWKWILTVIGGIILGIMTNLVSIPIGCWLGLDSCVLPSTPIATSTSPPITSIVSPATTEQVRENCVEHEILYSDIIGNIYLYDAESQFSTQLTDDSAIETHPRWSPDGRQIIFTITTGISYTLSLIDLEARQSRVIALPFGVTQSSPAVDWSSQGDIVFFGQNEVNQSLYFASIGQGAQTLTLQIEKEFSLPDNYVDFDFPSVAPNGEYVAFQARKNDHQDILFAPLAANTAKLAAYAIVNSNDDDHYPAWQQGDGRLVLYFSSNRSGNFSIYRQQVVPLLQSVEMVFVGGLSVLPIGMDNLYHVANNNGALDIYGIAALNVNPEPRADSSFDICTHR